MPTLSTRTTSRLGSPLFNDAARNAGARSILVKNLGKLVEEVKTNMRRGTPRGRLYRRGKITRGRGRNKAVVGSRIHRASAPGQVPAVETGKYLRSIRYRVKQGGRSGEIYSDAPQARFLERTRPHLEPAAKRRAKLLELELIRFFKSDR